MCFFDGHRWFKRNRVDVLHLDFAQFFDRLIAHQALFADTAPRFEGFVEHEGFLWPVISQSHVKASRGATPGEVKAYMEDKGFVQLNETDFVHGGMRSGRSS